MSANLFWRISLLFCLVTIPGQIADIIEEPQSRNASVNSNVTFTCSFTGDTGWWKANAVQLDNNDADVVVTMTVGAENIRMSTLTLWVSSTTKNATNITCHAALTDPLVVIDSNPALLLVQGLPGPVTNISVTSVNATYILITWIPPYTLAGVDVLAYDIIISSTEDEARFSTTSPNWWYQSDTVPNKVTVVPIIEGGAGHPAIYTKESPSTIDTTEGVHISATESSVPSTTEQASSVFSTIAVQVSSDPVPRNSNYPTDSSSARILISLVCVGILVVLIIVAIVAGVLVMYCRNRRSKRNDMYVSDVTNLELEHYEENLPDDTIGVNAKSGKIESLPESISAEGEMLSILDHTEDDEDEDSLISDNNEEDRMRLLSEPNGTEEEGSPKHDNTQEVVKQNSLKNVASHTKLLSKSMGPRSTLYADLPTDSYETQANEEALSTQTSTSESVPNRSFSRNIPGHRKDRRLMDV